MSNELPESFKLVVPNGCYEEIRDKLLEIGFYYYFPISKVNFIISDNKKIRYLEYLDDFMSDNFKHLKEITLTELMNAKPKKEKVCGGELKYTSFGWASLGFSECTKCGGFFRNKDICKEKCNKELQEESTNIVGKHYQNFKIQPIEFIEANDLDFHQGNIIKYICRYKYKDGIKDLKRAKHYIEIMIDIFNEENKK